jgi:hypothetical protein
MSQIDIKLMSIVIHLFVFHYRVSNKNQETFFNYDFKFLDVLVITYFIYLYIYGCIVRFGVKSLNY